MHQILCKKWNWVLKNTWNVESGIRRVYCKSKRCLQVVQALHRRSRRGEWRRSPWAAQHVNNQWKNWSSEENCYGASSNYYYRSCWGCRHIGWLMPSNFFGYFGSEACGSEVRSKISEFWPAHSAWLVRNFLVKNNTVIMPQPPYSPDLAPCDFFLLPRLKRTMKGRRFATI